MSGARPIDRHSLFEDAQALVSGALLIALAIDLYRTAGLLTGGTAGLAFLTQYSGVVSFGVAFFLINLPFYWLAIRRMGWPFTLRTLAAVTLVSLFTELTPRLIAFQALDPLYASILGGILMGIGLLILFRHRASLGGVNIAVLYLQDHFGWRAGKLQMLIDCLILLLALFVVELRAIALSIVGAVVLNMVLAVNHRPGRYSAIS
jgi:uncharacterized membrane-anchored protein YitT (DUF2179 family)